MPPDHHKELAKFLKERSRGDSTVTVYRDNSGNRPVPIGQFGTEFYSTIGAMDMQLHLPCANVEFAAYGKSDWLPNALASSIYWLKGRECDEWPLVCEDVVKDNAKSNYRHMAYVPSPFRLELSTGQEVKWLLGIPINDSEIGIQKEDVLERASQKYPAWLMRETA